jgi:hypothetical protein
MAGQQPRWGQGYHHENQQAYEQQCAQDPRYMYVQGGPDPRQGWPDPRSSYEQQSPRYSYDHQSAYDPRYGYEYSGYTYDQQRGYNSGQDAQYDYDSGFAGQEPYYPEEGSDWSDQPTGGANQYPHAEFIPLEDQSHDYQYDDDDEINLAEIDKVCGTYLCESSLHQNTRFCPE